jgi:hypothetical protein
MGGTGRGLLVLLVAIAVGLPRAVGARVEQPWYVPDQSKLQLAGWMGFISPGVGYSWFGRRLETDLFFGWVPPPVGGEHIVSLTGKATWLPWRLGLTEELTAHPLTLSAQVTYTFGSEYWVFEPSGRYPTPDYYPLPTALRAGLGVGGDVGRPLGSLERVSIYYELVALDLLLGYWIGNPASLGPSDVFSLAVGLRVAH